jgi:hypothetical protein
VPYPDIERLLVARLAGVLGVRFVTDLPSNLQQVLPLGQVNRIGGADDVITLDRANVDVDAYAGSRAAALELAERVREDLRMALPGAALPGGVVVCRVETLSGPAWRPYDDAGGVRRFGATYQITTRYQH